VQPVGAVLHRGEAADRVAREAGRDRRVRAVAQQPQRDVHADLRPAAGEQRAAAGEVGAGVAARAVERRAVGTELVVERVDVDVALLAAVAPARLQQRARALPGDLRRERKAARLVVDPPRRAGRRRGGDGGVVGEDRGAPLGTALLLDGLEQPADRTPDRHRVRVLGRQLLGLREHAQRVGEAVGGDAVHVRTPA
jgi:hypothetical protein